MAVIRFFHDVFQLFVASFAVEMPSMLFARRGGHTAQQRPRGWLVHTNQLTLIVT